MVRQHEAGEAEPQVTARRTTQGAACAALVATLAACAPPPPPGTQVYDPYEPVNRQIHAFNIGVDQAIADPMGEAINQLPPGFGVMIVNFSDNASLPNMAVNGLLQGDLETAVTNVMRFVINTTVGVVGLFDPASAIGLEEHETDFGETLAVWGMPEGAYVELPVLGPSTERDAVGVAVDFFLDPLQLFGLTPEALTSSYEILELDTVAQGAEIVVERGQYDALYDEIFYDSADGYAQLRLSYLQNRRYELGETDVPTEGQAAEDYYFDPYAEQ